jgi:endonuclease/exonuclease/phosphatase family metal-dependent hydrolase
MRICTFNVHLWADAQGRSNTGRVIELLRSLDCDVVALNEVLRQGGQLARVAAELGMDHAYGEASWLGNALLSKRPLRHVETFQLARLCDEARSALVATVDGPAGPFDVCATHLDVQHEATRLGQLESLRRAMETRAAPHLVLGDFNAVRLADYTPAALAVLRAHRAAGHREEPRSDVVTSMDRWGYKDGFRLARAGDLAAYPAEIERPLPDDDLATCWAGTRIDYIWATPVLLDGVRVRACRRVHSDTSDHLPVLIELDAREAARPDRTG